MMPSPSVALEFTTQRADTDLARVLIGELDADLLARYPPELIHGLHPGDAEDPRFLFVVARAGEQVIGCGALRPLEPGVAEVKRMYVRLPFRGQGFSRQILGFLESAAREAGYAVLRLETGTEQPEAIRLYESSGYERIPCYGEYIGNPLSVCFEKRSI